MLVGTVEVALVALVVGFPLALLTALYISEYAPTAAQERPLVAMVDLMAAVPSIIYGLWGFFVLEPQGQCTSSRWLSQHFGWIPLFKVNTDPNAALVGAVAATSARRSSPGCASAMMVIPLACAVMRGVFAQAPIGEREAAYALGSTRWGMIRTVVLPFGRGGIIGGTMLGLGRALGETIAVLLIISPAFEIKLSVLTVGTNTMSALIAARFGEATVHAAGRAADGRLRAVRHHARRQHHRRDLRQPQPQRIRDRDLRRSDSRRSTQTDAAPRRRRRRLQPTPTGDVPRDASPSGPSTITRR